MIFQSLEFFLFFGIVCLGFYLLPRVCRKYWLLAASWFFYLTYTPTFAFYLGGITLWSFLMGLLVGRTRESKPGVRRLVLTLGIVGTFASLVVIKYANFLMSNAGVLLSKLGVEKEMPVLKIAAPLGLSFFSFQAVGYLMDVYRGKRDAEKNIASYALFLSFFPIIISGPIERSTNLLKQIDEMPERRIDTYKIRHGLLTMMYGFFLKMVIADRLNTLVNTVFGKHTAYGGFVLVIAIVGFGLQLYCDFAGISTIALGAGEVLGFSLIDNFAFPYFSRSIGEFWRRWHISLSSWFRDYLYIPLGGNRKGTFRKYLNNMIVFIVSGIWHGAGWTFIIWGGLNGLYIVLGGLLKPVRDKVCSLCRIDRDNAGNSFLKMVFTFALVNFAWLFFRASSVDQAFAIIKQIATQPKAIQLFNGTLLKLGLDGAELTVLVISLLILLVVSIFGYHKIDWKDKLLKQGFVFRLIVYVVIFMALVIFAMYGPSFDASSFIYADF